MFCGIWNIDLRENVTNFASNILYFWSFGLLIYGNRSRCFWHFRHIFRYWWSEYSSILCHIRVDPPSILTPNSAKFIIVLVNSGAFSLSFLSEIRVESPSILNSNQPNFLPVLVNSGPFVYQFWAKFGSMHLRFWYQIYQICFLFK